MVLGGKVKKLIALIVILIISKFLIFATSESYSFLMNKAMMYEEKNQFFYAMATYLDALGEAEDYNCKKTAADNYFKISNQISNGKPGFDEYDEFTLHDSWIDLIKEFENYWLDNCPQMLKVNGIIKNGKIDLKTRTQNIVISVSFQYTKKFELLKSILINGLLNTDTSYWKEIKKIEDKDNNKTYIKIGAGRWNDPSWPYISIYSSSNSNLPDGLRKRIYDDYRKEQFFIPMLDTYVDYTWDNTDYEQLRTRGNGYRFYADIDLTDSNENTISKYKNKIFYEVYDSEDNPLNYFIFTVDVSADDIDKFVSVKIAHLYTTIFEEKVEKKNKIREVNFNSNIEEPDYAALLKTFVK